MISAAFLVACGSSEQPQAEVPQQEEPQQHVEAEANPASENTAQGGETAHLLDPLEFKAMLAGFEDAIVLDVRTPEEVAEGKIEGSINLNYHADDFKEQVKALNNEAPVFVYCKAGGRSGRAAAMLMENGHPMVVDLKGGLTAWHEAGLPVVQ